MLVVAVAAVTILALLPSAYFYTKYRQAEQRLANPAEFAQAETQELVTSVGKLIELPTDETPTVATVSDRERLANQPFFAKAQNGDKVLIYTTARKAVLFRPGANKIIEVAPINLGSESSPSAAATTPAPTRVRFVLYNGTSVVGLTKKYEPELLAKVAGAVVVDRDNAKKQDYQTSLLVDLTGQKAEEAKALADSLGISAGLLPAGEATPAADFLIILGEDQTK